MIFLTENRQGSKKGGSLSSRAAAHMWHKEALSQKRFLLKKVALDKSRERAAFL